MRYFKVELGGRALHKATPPAQPLAVTAGELARVGIPGHRAARVLEELQKIVDADPALNRRATLLRLAKNLSGLFL